jgi:CMP-N-acetylneuraminic acid synthetase
LSSDDEKILSAAETIGYKKIIRPAELGRPTSQHIDVIYHALEIIKKEGELPDICVVLLANNVTIKSQWISDCISKMQTDYSLTAVVPVYIDNDHHLLRAKSLNNDGTLSMYEKRIIGKVSTNRQDLPLCYFLAHNFWVLNVSYLLSGKPGQPPWEFMGNKILPYEIEESIDIHDEIDLIIAKEWIMKNISNTPPPHLNVLFFSYGFITVGLALFCFIALETKRSR